MDNVDNSLVKCYYATRKENRIETISVVIPWNGKKKKDPFLVQSTSNPSNTGRYLLKFKSTGNRTGGNGIHLTRTYKNVFT